MNSTCEDGRYLLQPGTAMQTCFVVNDLEATVGRWVEEMGAGPFYRIDVPDLERNYRGGPARDRIVSSIGFLGTGFIEILQPLNDEPSIYREVLDTMGDGAIHHIYPRLRPLNAQAFDAITDNYLAQGMELALSFQHPDFGRNHFYDARKTLGVFIEILEFSEDMYRLSDNAYRAHLNWDGERPLRSFAELF